MGLWNLFSGGKQAKELKFGSGDSRLGRGNAKIDIFVSGPTGCGVWTLIETFLQDASVEIRDGVWGRTTGGINTQVTLDGTSCGLHIIRGSNDVWNSDYIRHGIQHTNLFLICFDLCSPESFEGAKRKIRRISIFKDVEESGLKDSIILCGLRSDMVETRENLQKIKTVLLSTFEDNCLVEEILPFVAVPMEFQTHVDQFCKERGMEFFQVSSHTGINVATVFHRAMRKYDAYLTEKERQRKLRYARSKG